MAAYDLPLEWENVFDGDVSAESASDALVLSLVNLGRVDIPYISSVTGQDYKSVIASLKGYIYQNPLTWDECFYKGWETTEEYLSGNLKRKWKAAKEANSKYKGYFRENLQAIKKVLPPAVTSEDIYITLGSPWVPAEIIDEFIVHLFGKPYFDYMNPVYYQTVHDELTGIWEIPDKSRYYHSISVTETYGTNRMEALHIIEKTLNMKSITVKDEVVCTTNKSGKKMVINQAETIAAIEKQQKIIKEFQDWVWKDRSRKGKLERIFEEKYSCVRRRIYDGSFLTFPNMSQDITLYPYQKDAVARILFSGNTLLAHDVGAGKTYIMIAAGQELRRMGLSRKNMYVVPNNLVGQWKDIFNQMYPDANLLCIEPKTFKPNKREEQLKRIRDEEFDAIIIAYSCFDLIPLSRDYYRETLEEQKKAIQTAVFGKRRAPSKVYKKIENLTQKINELNTALDDLYDSVYFDELGITRLFVDEAHNFKNVPVESQTNNVLGITKNGSKRCKDMMDKVHMIQRNNDGKGVVLATGTPITNSITDAYIMQMYLQSGELGLLDLQNFDSWIGMFAERVSEFEVDVDTNNFRIATRFARFHNLPELTSLLAMIADFHHVEETDNIPEHDGYIDATISKTPDLKAYLDKISKRADNVRHGYVKRNEDNLLKITADGRKAALDIRLVDKAAAFSCQSKVYRCAENVADIYYRTSVSNSTQLVFCDTSTPKDDFNIYTELKERLMDFGVPEEQIAFIHDADTEAQRKKLFGKLRQGKLRILIGSTFKLGLGVNVQDKLIALHHIDVPWRPADMVQREGRILRRGNENSKVQIFRYIAEGSFDAYSWQLLETKQRFISELLSGTLVERSGSDVDEVALDYAEVKALAIGNPLIKKRVETNNELSRLLTLQRNALDKKIRLENELKDIPSRVSIIDTRIENCDSDIDYYSVWKKIDTKQNKDMTLKRKSIREFISQEVVKNVLEIQERRIMNYRGFDIVLPSNMQPNKPYIWLCRRGKYKVELGDTDIGILIRIDNALDGLENVRDKLIEDKNKLLVRGKEIKKELLKEEAFSDQIDECKRKLKEIDKELGVDKNE